MKRYLHFALAALLFLCVSSCGEKDVPGTLPEVQLAVSPETLAFESADKSNKIISVTAEGPWTAKSSADWIIVSPASGNGNGSVTVSVAENSNSERSGSVTIADAKISKTVSVTQESSGVNWIVPQPAKFDGVKHASTTYQLLIYSFADSNGDGIGDFKGIQSKLDYLDALGVSALWLSPAHPTGSYHAYDVNDYSTVNPLYGTEDDFKALVDAAHAKGISIYMDYVLNHSGSGNEWFKSVKADPVNSPYRDYYVLSKNPTADVASGAIDNYAGAKQPGMGSWHSLGDGNIGYKGRLHFKVDWTGNTKYVTVTETKDPVTAPLTSGAKRWIHIGSKGSLGMHETSANIFELTLDVDTDWGFLVRTSNDDSWPAGTKYGGKEGQNVIKFGVPFALDNSTAADIVFGETTYYFASFSSSMPDLNYGKYTDCENSPAFKAIAATADRWIKEFGVDGFRLDAVLWIYQNQTDANLRFLKQWYDHCNATYHAAGHAADELFMVAEAWESHNKEKLYYQSLPSCFEFDYWGVLKNALNGNAANYASTVNSFLFDHATQAQGYKVTSLHLTNHDQDRAASDLGKNLAKEKQAAAMLLTTGGKPFIYQGEELGYWGTKANGDEYVRTPMMWDKAGKDCAKKGVNNKVDNNMLTAAISVEAQDTDAESLLNVYRTWSRLRNTYPEFYEGSMGTTKAVTGGGNSIAAWTMTLDWEQMLIIHNCSASEKTVNIAESFNLDKPVALLGTATLKGHALTLGPYSSVVFELR